MPRFVWRLGLARAFTLRTWCPSLQTTASALLPTTLAFLCVMCSIVRERVCVYVCMCVCVYVCMCVCVYVCMCVFVSCSRPTRNVLQLFRRLARASLFSLTLTHYCFCFLLREMQMLCEAALGNMYERKHAEYVTKLPKGKVSLFSRVWRVCVSSM